MKKIINFLIFLPLVGQAEIFHVPQSIFFENNTLPKQPEPQIKTHLKTEDLPVSSITVSEQDSSKNKIEKLINYGVVKQQWVLLKQVLPL